MLKTVNNHGTYGNSPLSGRRLLPQIPDHIKCGEVYTWLCAEELYAVECKFCEDRPLCSLTEFPQHMEVWHADWQEPIQYTSDDEIYNTELLFTSNIGEQPDYPRLHNEAEDYINQYSISYTTEDSGLFETDDVKVRNQEHHLPNNEEESLESFEQVLIEQDNGNAIEPLQLDEEINTKEFYKDLREQLCKTEHKQKQINEVNQTFKNERVELRDNTTNIIRATENIIEESIEDVYDKETQSLNNILLKNCRNLKRNLTNNKENIKGIPNAYESATSKEQNFESRVDLRNSLKITEKIQQNLAEIKKVKKTLGKIIKAIKDLKRFEDSECETSDCQKHSGRQEKAFILRNLKKCLDSKEILRNNLNVWEELENQEKEASAINTRVNEKLENKNEIKVNINKSCKIENLFKTKNLKYKKNFKRNTRQMRHKLITDELKINETEIKENSVELSRNETNKLNDTEEETQRTAKGISANKTLLGSETETTECKPKIIKNKRNCLVKKKAQKSGDEAGCSKTFSKFEVKLNENEVLINKTAEEIQSENSESESGSAHGKEEDFINTTKKPMKTSKENKKIAKIEKGLRQNDSETTTTNFSDYLLKSSKRRTERVKRSSERKRKCKKHVQRKYKHLEVPVGQDKSGREIVEIASENLNKETEKSFFKNSKGAKGELSASETDVFNNVQKQYRLPALRNKIKRNWTISKAIKMNRRKLLSQHLCKEKLEQNECLEDACNLSSIKDKCPNQQINQYLENLEGFACDSTATGTCEAEGKSPKLKTNSGQRKEDLDNAAKVFNTYICQTQKNSSNKGFELDNDNEHGATSKAFDNTLEHTPTTGITESINQAKSQNFSQSLALESLPSLSPKTEEEHFEFYEPKEKLDHHHISHLIKLYHEHPRLWDQTHPEFYEPEICRQSWQEITDQWNEFCQRQFTIAEVRIRIRALCQRFVQERERLAFEGELDGVAKFPYYEEMQFLEQQKSLKDRRELCEQQNEQILEIYKKFPVLWHLSHFKLKQAKHRALAFQSLSQALKLSGLHLSSVTVRKRIHSLRKLYRLEKIRRLQAQAEKTPFQPKFRHYEKMKFLDKHMDPFLCCVCANIFQNLQSFRKHLETENHGSVCSEEIETQNNLDKQNLTGNSLGENVAATTQMSNANTTETTKPETPVFSAVNGYEMKYFSESENSKDILQRFTPISSSSDHILDTVLHLESNNLEKHSSNEPIGSPLHLEDQLIENIMENVINDDSLCQQGLDQFLNSLNHFEELSAGNCMRENIFNSPLLHSENSYVVEHPDIVTDTTSSIPSTQTNDLIFHSQLMLPANSCVLEHPDVVTRPNTENFVADFLPVKRSFVMEYPNRTATEHSEVNVLDQTPALASSPSPKFELKDTENSLLEKVQCSKSSLDLNCNSEPSETATKRSDSDADKVFQATPDTSTVPLPDYLIHKMIEVYRRYPQLWNPNHLDYNSRTSRRHAWCSLTAEFNSSVDKKLTWRTLHRKLTDYAKYYKKLITEQDKYERLEKQWTFFEDFKFMDDVIAVQDELQRNVHHRDNNLKIIALYKTLPQLWNISHPDYNKRSHKQRNIQLICNRLQEADNLQLTTERLKQRLIELRAQYRAAKKQRLKCLKNQQEFRSNKFEFYEALNFLDDHIDPFVCGKCKMEFKKLTDFNQHIRQEHITPTAFKKRSLTLLRQAPGKEKVCHICHKKFATRSNLIHHLKRHEGILNYQCSMCAKKFYASHALKVHMRSHTKECPYTCEKCGLSFTTVSKLNLHLKRHLNRKDFRCDICPKAFFTAFEKNRHERRHLNIRDQICSICGKTFVAGSSYYAHLMLHNGTKRYECDKCDKKFAQYPGLYKHKKRHH